MGGDHQRVVERDHAGHGLGHRALDLVSAGSAPSHRYAVTVPGAAARALDARHAHGAVESPPGRIVLEALDDGDRVVAQVLDDDVVAGQSRPARRSATATPTEWSRR